MIELFFLFWISSAFDPNATVYRIYSVDTWQKVYKYPHSPWVMQNFVDKLNEVCDEKNLGFRYELTQESDPPGWDEPAGVNKFLKNMGNYDAIISNAVSMLVAYGMIPLLTQLPSKIPFIMSGMSHSEQTIKSAPANMFFPTPVISSIYDRMLPLFKEHVLTKHKTDTFT